MKRCLILILLTKHRKLDFMADVLWPCHTADGRSRWLLWTEIQKHTVEHTHPTAHHALWCMMQ